MRPDLRYDFDVDMPTHRLTVVREFDAPLPRVWDCHTRSELLDQWFAPPPLTTVTRNFDFRDGGHWHYAIVDPDGNEYWSLVEYLTITPQRGYLSRDYFVDAERRVNPEMPGANWDVTFEDHGARSIVRTVVTYASEADLQTVIDMGMREGLSLTLERLDDLLETLE